MFKVYIKVDENNNIIAVNSNVFIKDLSNWICIDEGEGLKFMHAQNNYFAKPIVGANGTYRYSYVDNNVIELDEVEFTRLEEANMPEASFAPSQLDLIEAQVTYTAMMTDTLLEV